MPRATAPRRSLLDAACCRPARLRRRPVAGAVSRGSRSAAAACRTCRDNHGKGVTDRTMSRTPIRLAPSAHVDTFARDRLPPPDEWPDLLLDRPEFQYPERLNAAVELTDRMVERGFGDRVALVGNGRRR